MAVSRKPVIPPNTYPTKNEIILFLRVLIAGVGILHPLLSQHAQPAFVRRSASLAVLTDLLHSVPLSRIPISMKSGYLSVRSIRAGSPPVSSADIAHNESFLLTPVVRFWHWHPCIIVFYVDFPFEYTAMTKICIYPYVSLVANKTHLVFFRQSFADRNPVRFCGW